MKRKDLAPKRVWDSRTTTKFTQGIVVEETRRALFISGQVGRDKDGKMVGPDFESQCRRAFENIGFILSEAGAGFDSIVRLTAYFIDIKRDLPIFAKISSDYMKSNLPTQTVVEVKSLALPEFLIEIETTAVM